MKYRASFPVLLFPVLSFAVLALALCPAARLHGEDSDLPEEQGDIKDVILDLRGKMESLARKLDDGQPDEAKRLREAAERMRTARMDDLLEEVTRLLTSSSFLEAIGRQDTVIKELDTIIGLLERSRFDGQELESKLESIAQAALEAAKLSRSQEDLLSKTREALSRREGVESLRGMQKEVAKLRDLQAGLNQGKSPEELDPGADAADAKELESAAALLEKLVEKQRRTQEDVARLPGKDLPIRSARELAQRLDDLVRRAGEIVDGGEEALAEGQRSGADAKSGQAKASGPKTKSASGQTRPSGEASKGADESAAKAGSADSKEGSAASKEGSAGSKDAPSRDSAGSKEAGGESAGDAGSKEASGSREKDSKSEGGRSAGSKEGAEAGSPEAGSAGSRESGQAAPETKGAESRTGESASKEGGDAAARPLPGPSDLERERSARAAAARKEALAREAGDLSRDIRKLGGEVPEDAGAETKPSIESAAQSAERSARSLSEGDVERGVDGARKARDELKKARARLAQELRGMEERNASEAAGAIQDQAVLEKETTDAAGKLDEGARKGSSDAARSSLSKGAGALREAAKSMGDAARSLEGGNRSGAREQGGKAGEELSRAREAIEAGKKALGERTAAEKKSELERKLGRKTEEARKEVEELERKLRKKGEEGALAQARKDLGEAGQRMQNSAQASAQGQGEAARSEGEQALQRLDSAAQRLGDAEKQELERLDKEKLDKEKKEQEELARLTRQVAKKLADASKGSDQAQGRSDQLQGAAEDMDDAAENLEKEDPGSAEKSQQEALEKLRDAREKLAEEEERLAKLQREKEMLSMVSELGDVKAAEEKIHDETVKIHGGRQDRESRRQKLKVEQAVKKLVADQASLAEKVDGLNAKLKEELARVFTFVLRNVSADMRQVSESLKELETGTFTQFLQKEVIQDVDRLIAVLKEQIAKDEEESGKQNQQQGPQMNGDERRRLVPVVAELRMLKEMQIDVNRGTRDLEDVRQASEGKIGESWDKALNRLMQKQGSVTRMTVEIQKDFQKALHGDAEEGPDAEPGAEKRPGDGELEKKKPGEP